MSSLFPENKHKRCTAQAKEKRLTLEDEIECGRPLGVKWHSGKLYILDAYHGLFELDVAKERAEHMVRSRLCQNIFQGGARLSIFFLRFSLPVIQSCTFCSTMLSRVRRITLVGGQLKFGGGY